MEQTNVRKSWIRKFRDTFTKFRKRQVIAEENLTFALKTIGALEEDNDRIYRLLIETHGLLRQQQGWHVTPFIHVTESCWIENDLWLCSSVNGALLGEAEAEWKVGAKQRSLNILFRGTERSGLNPSDRAKCQLLISAIMLADGQPERSRAQAEEALREIKDKRVQSGDLAGIAQYLIGRNYLVMERPLDAAWAFSNAAATPGYEEKVRQYSQEAWQQVREMDHRTGQPSAPEKSISRESTEYSPSTEQDIQSSAIVELLFHHQYGITPLSSSQPEVCSEPSPLQSPNGLDEQISSREHRPGREGSVDTQFAQFSSQWS